MGSTVFRDWPGSPDAMAELYPRNPEPTVRVNFIASADGASAVDGLSGGLHGPGDKEVFDSLRMVCDALIVASGTVTAENYDALRLTEGARAWRIGAGLPAYPMMVLISGGLHLNLDQLIFTDAPIRPIVITKATAPRDRLAAVSRVAEVVIAGEDEVDLTGAVALLHARGADQLLCEGGPSLLGAMIAADVVTELCLTMSPLLVAGQSGRIATSPQAAPREMTLRHALTLQDMLFLRYVRKTSPA